MIAFLQEGHLLDVVLKRIRRRKIRRIRKIKRKTGVITMLAPIMIRKGVLVIERSPLCC